MSFVAKFPVSPETIEVLGYRVKETDAMWTGLFLERAWRRGLSPISGVRDPNLAVPWCHPNDRTGTAEDWNDCIYRVTPRAEVGRRWRGRTVEDVDFEKCDDGRWRVAVTFAGISPPAPAKRIDDGTSGEKEE